MGTCKPQTSVLDFILEFVGEEFEHCLGLERVFESRIELWIFSQFCNEMTSLLVALCHDVMRFFLLLLAFLTQLQNVQRDPLLLLLDATIDCFEGVPVVLNDMPKQYECVPPASCIKHRRLKNS